MLIRILLKHLKSHSQKSATFRFDKSAKNVKNNGLKNEKNLFSLLNLSQKYEKKISFDLAKHPKFDLNSNLRKNGYVCYIPFLKLPFVTPYPKNFDQAFVQISASMTVFMPLIMSPKFSEISFITT